MKRGPHKRTQNESVERHFVVSSGDASKNSLPRVRGDYDGNSRRIEMMFPPGYWGLPDINDEVVILCPFKDGMNRVMAGVVPNFMLGLNPGDRIIYTEGGHIILQKTGEITVVSDKTVTLKNKGGAEIVMNEDGIIDLN